jgi:hypothetical protein
MAKDRAREYVSDPLGGGGHVNVMKSGLIHCADSQGTARIEGEVIIRYGAPGNPLEKSPGMAADAGAGSSPNLLTKFSKRHQS